MKKQLLTTLLGVATVAIAMAATNSTLPADTNGDGTIDTTDAQLIYAYILGTADEAVTLTQVDVNGDGTANTLDVVEVYRYVKVGDVNVEDWADGGTIDGGEVEENEN